MSHLQKEVNEPIWIESSEDLSPKMDESTFGDPYTSHTGVVKVNLNEEVSTSGKDIKNLDDIMKFLTRLDLDMAYYSEKLVSLHVLLMHLLAWDNDLEAMAFNDSYISEKSVEKALVFDHLSGIVDSELREIERFFDVLKAQIVDACGEISLCKDLGELVIIMEEKLLDSEESLKQSQDQVLEIKMQLGKFQRDFSRFKYGKRENGEAIELSENSQLAEGRKSNKQTALQQRHVLRMLEKSLSRELDLEKKLSEHGQNVEQLKLKLHCTEQVAFRMEEAAEVIWGRFLEAENSTEVLKGISKEMLGQLQITQFNMNGFVQRELDISSKLEDCKKQLQAKEIIIRNLETSNAEYVSVNSEVFTLREKAKSLEEQLKDTKLKLKKVSSLYEDTQEQLSEIENILESVKENIYETENRAESAEAKVTQLTDTNVELTEELNFLKADNSSAKKISSLEKQCRELEIQLQNAKLSSEASQEQQNMLYSAIWDMETLIEDLKSKASKSEMKAESAEEKCIILSETNFELNKELSFLRDRVEILEASPDKPNDERETNAKEINLRTKLMMDMVVQLAMERERIQTQLCTLTKDNEVLVEKLNSTLKIEYGVISDDRDGARRETIFFENHQSRDPECTKASQELGSLTKCFQAG